MLVREAEVTCVSESSASPPALVPIFPLPGVVLFPRQILPLHIFEPRYRQLVHDALAGPRLIAIALLKPGFEEQYFTKQAPVHSVVCVGKIVRHEPLQDGKCNILLHGGARAEIVEECCQRPYRRARVRLLETVCGAEEDVAEQLRAALRSAVAECVSIEAGLCQEYLELFDGGLPLGEVADVLASGMPVDGELRQCLLAETDDAARAGMLREQIETIVKVARTSRRRVDVQPWSLN